MKKYTELGLALSKTDLGISLNPERQKLVSSMMYIFLGENSAVSLELHTSSNCDLPEGQVLANVFI